MSIAAHFSHAHRPVLIALAVSLALSVGALGGPAAVAGAQAPAAAAAAASAKAKKPKLTAKQRRARAKLHRERVCMKRASRNSYSYADYRRCLRKRAPRDVAKPAPKAPPAPAPASSPSQPPAAEPNPQKKAKNIILLIGDGMGVTHIDAARQRYYGASGLLNMERFPTTGRVSTYAVDEGNDNPNLVTDSASAATAWSSGVKTYNNALGKDTRGNVVPTIMEQAKQAGYRTGNVSNAEITDATPAGMFSHVSARACQGPLKTSSCTRPSGQGAGDTVIAEQVASNNTADVILGGGLARFEPADQQKMESNGYQVLGSFGDPAVGTDNGMQTAATQRVAVRDDLAGVSGKDKKVIGLFNRGNMTIEKSKRENPGSAQANEPSVEEMTTKAIGLLSDSDQASKKGFFLQVEGALIDKRSHANDAAQTLEEIKAFDDAVAAARAFAEKDGNTLVIVTADHECAGFNIIEKGSFANAEAANPPGNVDSGNTANNSRLQRQFSGNTRDLTRSPNGADGKVLPYNAPTNANANTFAPATFRTKDDPAGVEDGSTAASLWLSYLSGNHTGADVNIYTFGPQSSLFEGKEDNTDIYGRMKSALGLG